MNNHSIILKYFPDITNHQKDQFEQLWNLYHYWNAKINVISRKDIENLYIHHILHSLGIAKIIQFTNSSTILDVGTGGGFPGIPLAILFPNTQFTLIDSIGKKIKVATSIIEECHLMNSTAVHTNAKFIHDKYDFIVSRAVMNIEDLISIIKKNIHHNSKNTLSNGLICLKGDTIYEEIKNLHKPSQIWNLSDFFDEEFFKTKKLIHVTL